GYLRDAGLRRYRAGTGLPHLWRAGGHLRCADARLVDCPDLRRHQPRSRPRSGLRGPRTRRVPPTPAALVDPHSASSSDGQHVTSKLETRAPVISGSGSGAGLAYSSSGTASRIFRQDLLRLGKGRLTVRIVRAPHHVVDADDVAQADADDVLRDAWD